MLKEGVYTLSLPEENISWPLVYSQTGCISAGLGVFDIQYRWNFIAGIIKKMN